METQIIKSKPSNVERATILMWIVMGLSALSSVLNFSFVSSQTGVAFALFTMGFTYAFMIFFYVKLAAGKNWARWTLLIFMIGGLLISVSTLPTEWSRSPLSVCNRLDPPHHFGHATRAADANDGAGFPLRRSAMTFAR